MSITKIQSESVNLEDDFAFTGTVTGAGGVNTPAFYVTKNSTQTISNSTHTELTWQTEVLDTDSNFASNRFTPTTAGYYQISLSVRMDSTDTETQLWIKKNTSQYTLYDEVNLQWQMNGSRIFYANGTGDYFTAGVWQGSGSDKTVNSSDQHTAFQGFKIIT